MDLTALTGCSNGAKWWSCSIDNQLYTGCCAVNACKQVPVGCPSVHPTPTTTIITILDGDITLPHMVETETSNPIRTLFPVQSHSSSVTMIGAPSFSTLMDLTRTTTIYLPEAHSSSPTPSLVPTGATADAPTSPWAGAGSIPVPALVVLILVGALLGVVWSIMLWRAWNRRRGRKKPSHSHSPGAEGQDQQMGEQHHVPVNPEAFPFSPAHVRRGGQGQGHRKSYRSSFDSTARAVSPASMRRVGYTKASFTSRDMDSGLVHNARFSNASPTLGEMDSGPMHNARYTNASPTLGETDGGPVHLARTLSGSPTLGEYDGSPFGSELDAFPSPPRSRPAFSVSERNERLGSIFSTSTLTGGPSSVVRIWSDNEDGKLYDGKKL